MTAAFASAFRSEDWGLVLGQCHDLGKASQEFQDYLHASSVAKAEDASERAGKAGSVDHKTFGARYVAKNASKIQGELLAYCIAGHHGGLSNALSTDDATQRATLRARLDDRYPVLHALPEVPLPCPALPPLRIPWEAPAGMNIPFALSFYTRMLFSCLVDADRTCTEAFCDPKMSAERHVTRPSIAQLRQELEAYLNRLAETAEPTAVNRVRQEVLAECRAAAAAAPGFFSLQVPTGGGKTLSSLMFALDHANTHAGQHGFRRVIVAIPFTSIIEQTADVYRKALGPFAQAGLLEHHTNVQPERETRANQLATENWDAPLIVTTNVQLFESLFAGHTTPCRKLHRLAGSVIILDEAQTLPVELLAPTLLALQELVKRYGCTVVLCTATQPALERREGFAIGLEQVRSIIADPKELFGALRRVEVHYEGKLTDAELLSRLLAEPKVLTIVNTRAHAAQLFNEVRGQSEPGTCFHLSTLMCGAHRRQVLAVIREQVQTAACRVVSTQLIEAGVDLDFPVVYRAEAGFDSLAQAAGRCNREGKLPGLGIVHVFEAERRPPRGFLADTAQVARELLPWYPDPLVPSSIEAYFQHYYWRSADVLDKYGVLPCFSLDSKGTVFQFRDAEAAYKIIRDEQVHVLIPFDPAAKKWLDELARGYVEFIPQRILQLYLVSIPERAANLLERSGAARKHESGVWLLLRDDVYDPEQGLMLGDPALDERAWGV
jgi:CRISPR-associated endonuclease/helicase Cas3